MLLNGRSHFSRKKVRLLVTEIFHSILVHTEGAEEIDFNEEDEAKLKEAMGEIQITHSPNIEKAQKKKEVLKQKLKFISKMLVMQKILRKENEKILQIKNQNNDKLPQGLLTEGKKALDFFLQVLKEDSVNERIPN